MDADRPHQLGRLPECASAALQYASLNWPTENGWVNYNALQLLTYFLTVFIAAPLAFISGIRTSSAWPKKAAALNKAYPIELARAIHFPVMIYFVAFIVVHVFLVLATGALRNLNHMYARQRRRRLARLLDLPRVGGRDGGGMVPGPAHLPAPHCLPDGQSQPLRPAGGPPVSRSRYRPSLSLW